MDDRYTHELTRPPHRGSGSRWDEAPPLLREVAIVADGITLFVPNEPDEPDEDPWFMEIFDLGSYQGETTDFAQTVTPCRPEIERAVGSDVIDWLFSLTAVGRTQTGAQLLIGRDTDGSNGVWRIDAYELAGAIVRDKADNPASPTLVE